MTTVSANEILKLITDNRIGLQWMSDFEFSVTYKGECVMYDHFSPKLEMHEYLMKAILHCINLSCTV